MIIRPTCFVIEGSFEKSVKKFRTLAKKKQKENKEEKK